MTGKTITGIPLDEVMTHLAAPFDESAFDSNSRNRGGIEYLPVETMEARLDDVFGKIGYDRIVSDLQTIEFGATTTVIVKMACIFYDSEHTAILTKSAHGGSDLQINDNGNAVSIKSAVASAESDAFKKICSSLGIGTEQLRAKNTFGNNAASLKEFTVMVKGNWKRKDSYIKADVEYNKAIVELCIFKDSFNEIEKRFTIERLINESTGRTLTFKGTENTYNGKQQLILKGF